MPGKYHIETKEVPPRFNAVGRFGIIDLYETCARGCRNCVKKKCIYDIHKKEFDFAHSLDRPTEFMNECMNCLMCVQNCTRGALTRTQNPEYTWLGNEYWKPAIIAGIWKMAATAKLPVSGAGYGGPFSGPGFDSMWTDMSEIVRPTRDGIHGREYISTSVDIGGLPSNLEFSPGGELLGEESPVIDLPVPFILEVPRFGTVSRNVLEAMTRAARGMDTLFALDAEDAEEFAAGYAGWLAPRVKNSAIEKHAALIKSVRMICLEDSPDVLNAVARVKAINPGAVVKIRLALGDGADERVIELVEAGVEAIQLSADINGDIAYSDGRVEFIKDAFRRIHSLLVDRCVRDRATLIADGGIAMAEHLAKIIICGADCASLGVPFLVAMECRMCGACSRGVECPVNMSEVPPEDGAWRVMNLAAAWRNQLLEVLGAMGIREARRLRGEFGRAMFREDLERDTFQKIFAGA